METDSKKYQWLVSNIKQIRERQERQENIIQESVLDSSINLRLHRLTIETLLLGFTNPGLLEEMKPGILKEVNRLIKDE